MSDLVPDPSHGRYEKIEFGENYRVKLLDELWMIEEDEDGESTVRRVEQDLIRPVELSRDTRT